MTEATFFYGKFERILIVDWDVHHGNGVQRCFFDDPRVMYVSLHRLDAFPFNPHESDCHVIGAGRGTGYTVNIAWPKVNSNFLVKSLEVLTF